MESIHGLIIRLELMYLLHFGNQDLLYIPITSAKIFILCIVLTGKVMEAYGCGNNHLLLVQWKTRHLEKYSPLHFTRASPTVACFPMDVEAGAVVAASTLASHSCPSVAAAALLVHQSGGHLLPAMAAPPGSTPAPTPKAGMLGHAAANAVGPAVGELGHAAPPRSVQCVH
jgi:hypothetical protein